MTAPTDNVPPIVFADIGDQTEPSVVARTMQVVGGTVQGRVRPALQNAGTRLSPMYVAARDTARVAGGQLAAGADRARPVLIDAGGRTWDTMQVRVVPAVRDSRDRRTPVLTAAADRSGATARAVATRITVGTDPIAQEAARRGANIVLALRGGTVTPAASRARTVRRLLAVAAAAGMSYGAWWALAGKPDSLWKNTAVGDRLRHANATTAAQSEGAPPEHVELSMVEDLDTAPVTDPLLPPDLPVIVLASSLDEQPIGDFDMTPPGDPILGPPLS